MAAFAQPAELTPAWDFRKSVEELKAQTARLTPLVEQVDPKNWIAKGAPEAYIGQWDALRAEIGYLIRTADALARDPEKTTVTLEAYLRLQAVEAMLGSLSQGVRRYQNPALADLLEAMVTENHNHRVRLREYLVELVAAKEAELRIVDQEAQRCRAALIRQPVQSKKTESKRP
ncbi:MAG: hypothetical protein FJW20_13335 [Acidimicrobiia bacterium]|nr:hypothetical protein [Acidimicrobiia bacterium]